MKIGIASLGSSGSHFLHILHRKGFDVTGFDPKPDGFYIPCGYATNERMMKQLLLIAGLDSG